METQYLAMSEYNVSLEALLTDSLRAGELLATLDLISMEAYSHDVYSKEYDMCAERGLRALDKAGIDPELLYLTTEGFSTTSERIIAGLRKLVTDLIALLIDFWDEAFGVAIRVYRKADATRQLADALKSPRPKNNFVEGQFTLLRVLSPTSPTMGVPLPMARDLLRDTKSLLEGYTPRLNAYLMRGLNDYVDPPVPKIKTPSTLPGTPILVSRDPEQIVWGMKFTAVRTGGDQKISRMAVATREDLRNICSQVMETADVVKGFEREWRTTKRGLEDIIKRLESAGAEGFDTAKARRMAFAAAGLPREWSRYSMQLMLYLTRYANVCVQQYE